MQKYSISLLLGLAALAAGISYVLVQPAAQHAAKIHPVWTEVAWGFGNDQWGAGTRFHCAARACGTDVDLYLRAKNGFCNCTTGVADDDELERVADLDLFGDERSALLPGHPIEVRWMKGRSRPYHFSGRPSDGKSVIAIAFNERCDAIVASLVANDNHPDIYEEAAMVFLNGDVVLHWAEAKLGL